MSSAGPQVPQECLSGDMFRSSLLGPQPQILGPSLLQADLDCDLHSPLQPLLFAVDTGCGVFRHRSISPSSLLDTAISEEARQSQGLEEEQEAQKPLPGSTGRRHTLAEVSTCFPCAPPSKCPCGPRTQPGGVTA